MYQLKTQSLTSASCITSKAHETTTEKGEIRVHMEGEVGVGEQDIPFLSHIREID
jgi:hypothetical protein